MQSNFYVGPSVAATEFSELELVVYIIHSKYWVKIH